MPLLLTTTSIACDQEKPIEANQEPVFVDFSVSPSDGVLTSSQLICVATAEDENNDSLTIDIEWTLSNGDVLGNTFLLQLTPDIVSPNDEVTCTATLTDGGSDPKIQSASVTVGNTLPVIDTVSIDPNSDITVSSTVTCSASGSDADNEELTWSYVWTNDGEELGTEAALVLNADIVDPEDTLTCTATATDESGGTVSESESVTMGNTAPEIGSLVLSPSEATSQDTIECIASEITDLDEDEVTISYSWSIDGTDMENDTATIEGPFAVGSEIHCVATPNDGMVDGEAVSASTTIQNTDPEISSVSITPSTDVEANTMLLCAQVSSDIDGGDLSVSYAWTDGQGNTLGSEANLQLDPVSNSVEDSITCTVTVLDEHGASVSQSESVSIINTDPSIDTAASISGTATTGATLTCSSAFSDLNDGTLTPTYSWTNSDGAELGTSADYIISSTDTDPGDTLTCTATGTDTNGGSVSSSATIDVENTDPSLDTAASISGTATTGATLTCSAVFSDLDDGTLTPTYSWTTSDGTEIGSVADYVISATDTDPGDTLTCTATGTDSSGVSVSSSADTTIVNSEPTTPGVTLTAGDGYAMEQDVLCAVTTESTDVDDQIIEYVYTWVDSDGVATRETGPTTDLSDALPAAQAGLDTWTCSVIANDGTVSSSTTSASITLTYSSDTLSAGDLVITELMYNPTAVSDSNGEWVEIYNDTASTINLLGLELSDDQAITTIDMVVMVAAGEYAVLGNNADETANGGVDVDYDYGSVQLNNSGAQYLSIANGSGDIDRIDWDNAGVTMPDASGGSIILSSLEIDATSNDSGDYWCDAASPFGDGDLGSPGEENAECDFDQDGIYERLDCDDANDTITDSGTGELDTCAAASCLEILDNGYDAGDGSYWIDPDATGAFEVHCDMTTDGGGWTLAWAHDGVTNYNSTSLGYDISSTELYANSIDAMVSYIDSANEMTTTWASFSIPVNWQTSSPMESYQEDTLVDANIGGTLVSNVTLRYGYGDFDFSGSPRNCGSFSWLAGTSSFGTICLDHVDAPNFNGFSVPNGPPAGTGSTDYCSLGTEDPYWNTNCSSSLRFAIFVR
jgi:hypothetical protein